MAGTTVGTRPATQQATAGGSGAPQLNISQPDESTFQGLFDSGAFEPSTNEVKKTVQRYHADSDQADEPDEGDDGKEDSSAQSDDDEPANESSDEESASESAESSESEEGEGDEGKGPAYASIDEFLTAHKIDPESFRGLNVAVKINGETKLVPYADVLKSYQLEGAITQKSQAFATQQQEWDQERTAVQTLYKQQLQQAQNLGQYAYDQLVAEYKAIPWDQLKVADPAIWTQKQLEFQQRHQTITGHLQQVSQAQAAETQRSQQELIANLPKQREKMLESRPEWRDSNKFDEARKSMKEYGTRLGFSENELGSITDYRHMLILSDAASYAALKASAPETLKKVRAAPLMAKPGARQGRDPRTVARKQAQERFMKNPNDPDAGAAYFQTLVS